MERVPRPVHLYVKTHRATGLKYFGRTTSNPHTYVGSGAYWVRHLREFGNNVTTEVVGTFVDQAELRVAATSYSTRHNIARSTDWANLLPEDGGEDGAGYSPLRDHRQQVAALDAAVHRRMHAGAAHRGVVGSQSTSGGTPGSDTPWGLILVGLAIVAAVIYFNAAGSDRRRSDSGPTNAPDPGTSVECRQAVAEMKRAKAKEYRAGDLDRDGDGQIDDVANWQRLTQLANEAEDEAYESCN